ncbi:MAG: Ig-like domain-containing protein, partial [Candidatus Cloacimonetes bacterium]|nr:Ig-like domain-containing protein [Candidatus Cloacimonadota bacterium]
MQDFENSSPEQLTETPPPAAKTDSTEILEPQVSDNEEASSKFSKFVSFIKERKFLLIGFFTVLIVVIVGFLVFSKKEVPLLPTVKPKMVPVLAKDLKMEALVKDSIGVAPGSAYVLSSSEELSAGLVKKALVINPEFDFETEQVSEKEVKIFPQGNLSENTVYQFTLANETETTGDDPSWAFQIKNPFRVINTLPRNEATNVPIDSGIEITFSHENYQDIDNFFTISPQVVGRFERHKRTVVFVSKGLMPSTVYTVTIKKGLGLTGSEEKLARDFLFQFETAPKQEAGGQVYFQFSKEFAEYPSNEKPALGFYSYDLPENLELPFEIFQYSSQETFLAALKGKDTLPLWAYYSRENFLYPADGLTKVASFKSPLQKGDYQDYVIFPEAVPNGYYLVQTEHSGKKKQSLLQITDLASFLTTSNTKSLIWVNDVSSGEVVAGATVNLVDSNLKQQTDEEGIAYFDTPEELKDAKKRYYFTVTTSEGKSAVVPVIQDYGSTYYYNYFDREYLVKQDYWSYLYLDRPVYLPNDKISFWGIVKHRDDPSKHPTLTIKLTESGYYGYNHESVSIFEKDVTPTDFGTFHDEIPVQNLKPGGYEVQVLVGDEVLTSAWLSVEDYVKPAYQISVESDKKAIFAGETVNLKGKTTFFEGTAVPMAALKVTGSHESELSSDEKGEFQLPYTPSYVDNENTQYPISSQFEFVPKLAEEGEIIGAASLQVFGPKIDLSTKGNHEGETKAKVEMIVKEITLEQLNNDTAQNDNDYLGSPVAGQKIDGKIYVTRWEKQEIGDYYDFINKKVQKKYQYNYVREFFKDFSVTTDNNGQALYTFDIEAEKSYEIKLEAKDVSGRTARDTVYVYGSRYASGGTDYRRYQRYQLVTIDEVDSYALGDKVSLAIKKGDESLPQEQTPRYLFALAQRGIRKYTLRQEPSFEFDFAVNYVPNVLAKAVYFNGRTYFQTGSLNLEYRQEDKKLNIEVSLDKESYEPAAEVKLDVLVKDKDGKGQVSEVNLSLVDEALFALQGQYVDTLGSLYSNVSSGIIQTYASHQYPLETGAEGGGACFLQGTKVKMADGSYQGIEKVKVGDLISTRQNEWSNELIAAKVARVDKHLVDYILLLNDSLWVTPEHRMFINGRWQEIGLSQVGDFLLNENGKQVPITSIEQKHGSFTVFNLEIENFKTYFAGGFYVHNIKGREYFAD